MSGDGLAKRFRFLPNGNVTVSYTWEETVGQPSDFFTTESGSLLRVLWSLEPGRTSGPFRSRRWPSLNGGLDRTLVCVTRGGLVPAAIVARELNVRLIETVCVESYTGIGRQGELRVLKGISDTITAGKHAEGQGVLIVDDLVDTGKTARVVREIIPKAHFATVYAKPMGRPLVDTFVTEVSQDTWIFFPWDTGLAFVPPIREGG